MAEVMTKGTRIHFVRPQETGCRPGTLLADSFTEAVHFPRPGTHHFAHFAYGELPGSDSKHTFEASRPHDPVGAKDTWHLAKECPFVERPAPKERPPQPDRPPQSG